MGSKQTGSTSSAIAKLAQTGGGSSRSSGTGSGSSAISKLAQKPNQNLEDSIKILSRQMAKAMTSPGSKSSLYQYTPYQIAMQKAMDDAEQEKNFTNSGLSREEYYQQTAAAANRAGEKSTGMSRLYNPNATKKDEAGYDPFASKGSNFINNWYGKYVLNKQNLKEQGAENATFKDYLTGKFVAPTKEQRTAAEQKTADEMARFNEDPSAFLEELMIDSAKANAALDYATRHRYDDETAGMMADPYNTWRGITEAKNDAARANEEYEAYIRGEKESADEAFRHLETGHVTLAPNIVEGLRNANDRLIEGRSNITGRIEDRREYYPQEGWTDEQRRVHGYLYATDRERANQYAMNINQQLNYWAGKEKAEEITEDGVTAGEWAKAQGARFISGTDYLLNVMEYNMEGAVSGTPHITNNDQEASFNQIANAVDTAISNQLNGYDEATGTYSRVLDDSIPVVGGKGWGDAYQLGMSILQSTLASATGEAGTYMIFFGSAAQSSYEQALERGATQGQALTIGALNGIAEGLFEAASIERVKALSDMAADRSTVLAWLRAIGLSGAIEGSEELNTGIADMIIDAAVMGDKSETQQAIRNYMAQGMSYDEAWKAAFMDNLNSLAYDALGGAISGALHGNIFTGAGMVRNAVTTYQGDARALMQEAQERGVKGAREVGAHEDVKLTNYQANKLQAGIVKSAGGMENYVQERKAKAEQDYKQLEQDYVVVRNALQTLEMNDDYAAELMRGFRTGTASAQEYAEGVRQAFTAGRIGLTLEQAREQFADTKLSRKQFENAFNIGQKNKTPDIAGAKAKIDGKDYNIRMKGSDTVVFTTAGLKSIEMPRTEALTREGVEMPAEVVQLMHAVEQFGENAGEIYNLYTGNMGIDSYAAAMNSAIHWAESGVLRERIESGRALGQRTNLTRLTDEQIALAEKIGEARRAERKASAKARSESFEKKTVKPGKTGRVITNGAVTARGEKLKGIDFKNLNKQQKDAVKAIRAFANLVKIDYVIYDGVRAGTNTEGTEAEKSWGFYEDGRIYLNINAGTGNDYIAVATLAHELTHFMQDFAAEEYGQLKDEIVKIYYNNDPAEFERIVDLRMRTGGEEGKTLSHDAAVDELIANSCMEMLNDPKAIDQLCADNPTLGQQILDFLKKLIKDIFGDIKRIPFEENAFYRAHYDAFTNAQDLFAAGLKKAAENARKGEAATESRQFMVGYTTDNRPVAIIEEDILSGVPESEWVNTVKNTMKDRFANGIPIAGRLIKVNSITRREYVGSGDTAGIRATDGTIYADKMKAAGAIDDIILATTNYVNEDLTHNRKDNFKEFARGSVLMRIGGNDYSADVIVGFTTGDAMVLYDVVRLTPATFTVKQKQNRGSQTNGDNTEIRSDDSASEEIITDLAEKSNNEISEERQYQRPDGSTELAIYVKDGHKANGGTVDFIGAILDGRKKGETRDHKGLTRKSWVGLSKDGMVYGRVRLGEPYKISNTSPEYRDAMIEGTEYDIADGETKYYYPILEVEDFRDNPRPILQNGNYGKYEAAAREAETERKPVNVDAQNATEEATVTEDGKTYPLRQYSLKSMEYDIQDGKMFDDLATHTSMSEKEIEDLRSDLLHLTDLIALHRDILDMNETYGKENRPFKPFKPNSDPLYTLSLDFSTLCRKRLMTQYVIEKLQTELTDSETGKRGRALSAEEQLAVRDLMKEYAKQEKALKVACAMCYVEAARLKAPKQINKFLRNPESAMLRYFALKNKEFNDSVKQAQADFKVKRGYAANTAKKNMKPADVTALNKLSGKLRDEYGSKAHPASEEELEAIRIAKSLPNSTFLTAANLARLAEEHPLIYDAYTATIRTATRSKSLEADIPYYYGDSRGVVSDEFIESVNAENGMRFSSWSDFQIEHMLDMMTAVIELSTRKCAMHGYTKFLEQVRIFGKTGMMFNMSGVPQGTGLKADGSLDFSPTESVLVRSEDGSEYDAITAREQFPETAGLQCIGISQEHIQALLASDIIDYVIPYHTSGLNASLRRMAQISNWADFTSFQNATEDKSIKFDEKIHDKETWHKEPVFSEFFTAAKDPANGYKEGEQGIVTMRRAADLYKKMCAERGLRPKFSWGNSKVDADFSNDPNYWKLLIDRKMINQNTGKLIEQKPVTPTFDFGLIENMVQDAVDAYDSTLQDRALSYVREHIDELPKRITELKKSGAVKKAKADAKKADELSLRFNELQAGVVAAATEGSMKQAAADEERSRAYQKFDTSVNQFNQGFYSRAEQVVTENMPGKMAGDQVIKFLTGKGVKAEEIRWSGLAQFLEGKKSVTQADVLSFLQQNRVQVETKILDDSEREKLIEEGYQYDPMSNSDYPTREDFEQEMKEKYGDGVTFEETDIEPVEDLAVTSGPYYVATTENGEVVGYTERLDVDPWDLEDDMFRDGTKWRQYKVDGGENYREILFKFPGSDYMNNASKTHWVHNAPGTFAHARVQDFTDDRGKRVLFVDEIQSDWHNAGAKAGFIGVNVENKVAQREKAREDLVRRREDALARWREINSRAIDMTDSLYGLLEELGNGRKFTINWDSVYDYVVGETDSPRAYDTWGNQQSVLDAFSKILEDEKLLTDVRDVRQKAKASKTERDAIDSEVRKIREETAHFQPAPEAPFAGTSDSYLLFVVKNLLRMAAEGGYDTVAWTPADMQVARWDKKYAEGYSIEYDQELPKLMRKYGNQWGMKVGSTWLNQGQEEVWSADLTDAMKQSVTQTGQPFFQKYNPAVEETAEEQENRKAAETRTREEKQLLHETVVSLNRELKKLNWKLSGGNEVREDDCLKLARDYKKTYGSTVNTQELAADIKALGDYIVSAEELDDEKIRAAAERIAYKLIESAREVEDMWSMRNQDLERHQAAASWIQGKKFYFPENLRGDLAREGGYNAFRRANMGRFTLSSKDGDSIDALYTELHDTYPDLFPELTNEGDQIIRMAEIFEEAKPDMVNPYAYEDDNFLTEVANGIYEDVLGEGIRQKAPSLMARVNLTEADIENEAPALSGEELAKVQKDLAAIGKELEAATAKADALEKRWETVSANEELAQKKLAQAEGRIQRLSNMLQTESLNGKLTAQQRQEAENSLKKALAEKAKLEKLLQKAKDNTALVRQERNEIRKGKREAEQKRDSLQRQLNRETARNAVLKGKLSDNAQRTRDRLAALRAEKNARIAQIRAEGAAKVEEVRATEKAEKWARVASERERYQNIARRARERRIEAQTRGTLRKRITKIYNEFARDITHPTEGHHIPPEMMKQAVDVLQALNMDTSREGTKSGEKLKEKLAKLKVTYDAVQNDKDFRNAAVYDDTVSEMLQAMIEEVGDTPINQMTAKQMESVYNVLVAMRTTARTALKIKMQGEERDAYEVARKMTSEVRSGQKPSRGAVGAYLNTQLTPERMFNRLGGYHKGNTWSQVYRMLNDGQLESTRIFVEGSRIFEKLLNSKDYDSYVSPKNTVDIGLKDENGNAVPVTHDMLVSLWMHLQNEDNVRHAILGGLTIPNQKQYYAGNRARGSEEAVRALGATLPELKRAMELREQAQQTEDPELKKEFWKEINDLREKAMGHATTLYNKVADSMTAYDRQWAAALTELFDVYSKEQLNKTTMEVYGIKRASVEHYWPINVDGDFLNTPFESVAKDFSIENAGFMKERVNSSKPIRLVGSSDVASSQLKKVSQYAGLMPVIRSFNKIWGKTQIGYQDSLKNAVHTIYGDTGVKYIENLMADLNGARGGQESPFGQALNKLRGNMAQAALTLSMRTAFGQTASYPTAAAVVGWKPLLKALAKGGKSGRVFSRADRELIEQYSPLLRYRSMGYSTTELGDISTSNSRMAQIWKKMRWLTGWIQAMDSATVGRLWYAAEYYVDDHNNTLKKGTDAYYEEVAKVFNDIVEKTQPDYTTMQRPDILRNPNALVRSLTMFMTQRLQNANIMYDAAATLTQMKKDYAAGTYGVTKEDVHQAAVNSRRAAASVIIAGVTITAFKFLADVVMHSMNAYRDDDKDLTAESVGMQLLDMFLDSMIGNMLGGSEIYDLVESKVFGKTYYGIEVSGVSTVSDVAEDMSKLFDKIRESGFKVGEYTKELNKMAKDVAQLLGIPLSNAEKIVGGIINHGKDIANGEFGSFEAGVERKTSQNGHRLYRAYTEGDDAKVKKIRAEAGENQDALNQNLAGYIKDLYKEGEITEEEATQQLIKYAEVGKYTAAEAVSKINFEKDFGFKFDDLKDHYLEGDMSAVETRNALVRYGGKTTESAKETVEGWKEKYDFDKRYGTEYEKYDLSFAGAKQYYLNYRSETTLEKFADQWKKYGATVVKNYYKNGWKNTGLTIDQYNKYGVDAPIYGDAKTQAAFSVWSTTLKPGGMTIERFMAFLKSADLDSNNSLKQDELGKALQAAIKNKELSYAEAEALWGSQGWKSSFKKWSKKKHK